MLTQEQIESFHANGFLIMRGLYNGEELQRLTDAVNRTQAQGLAGEGEHHLHLMGPHGEKVYWRSEQMWQRDPIFQAVTVKPELLENIGQCVGQAFYPWNDSLVVKLPKQGAAVPWHQDPPYGKPERETTFAVPNFTTDIYLDHSGMDNGCVYAIPGHHLVGHVDIKRHSDAELIERCGAVPIEMEAGDVLFHALSTPHGSRPNLSETQRRIFYIHYLADEVFADGYGVLNEEWVKQKLGWGETRQTLVEEMIAARKSFGHDSFETSNTLTFGEGGFTFTGTPNTLPDHWGTLAAAYSPEEKAKRKSLESVCV